MSQEEEGEFDVTKPSTSYEKLEDIISGTNDDAVKRLSDAMNLMQQPLQKMIELDVSYHASLQEVGRLQEVLNYVDFTSLTRERVDEIFDQMENGLRVAQHLALWKSAVIYEADLKLQDLIGRISEPQQDKQESSKTKGPRSKRIFLTAKENVRRSDREIQTQSVAKGKGKDSPSSSNSTPEQQSLPGRRKKMKVAESSEGRSVFKKRGAGRPRLPRKPRQTTNEATETVEDPNQPDTLYCLCRQVSYGDMILCENSKCNEWYHFPCVQLRQKPKGRWFCPHCRGDRCDVINPDLVG